MILCMLAALCFHTSPDSLPQQPEIKKDYSGQLIASGLLSAGFGIGAAVFHTRANQAYEDYQSSSTMAQALERWETVRTFDLYRNLCIAGSILFLARFVYYHMKQDDEPSPTGLFPCLDVEYSRSLQISIGLQRYL